MHDAIPDDSGGPPLSILVDSVSEFVPDDAEFRSPSAACPSPDNAFDCDRVVECDVASLASPLSPDRCVFEPIRELHHGI